MNQQSKEGDKINQMLQDAASLSIDGYILLIGYLQLGMQNKYAASVIKHTVPVEERQLENEIDYGFNDGILDQIEEPPAKKEEPQVDAGPDLDLTTIHPTILTLRETIDAKFDATDANELTMRMEKIHQLVTSLYVSITQGEINNNSTQQLYMLDILTDCATLASNYYKATNNYGFFNAVTQCHDIAHICLAQETEPDLSKERFAHFLER